MFTMFETTELLISTCILVLGLSMFRFGRPRLLRTSYLAQMAAPLLFIKATGLVIVALAVLVDVFLLVHHYLPGVTKFFDPFYYVLCIVVVMNLFHYADLQKKQKRINDAKKDAPARKCDDRFH